MQAATPPSSMPMIRVSRAVGRNIKNTNPRLIASRAIVIGGTTTMNQTSWKRASSTRDHHDHRHQRACGLRLRECAWGSAFVRARWVRDGPVTAGPIA